VCICGLVGYRVSEGTEFLKSRVFLCAELNLELVDMGRHWTTLLYGVAKGYLLITCSYVVATTCEVGYSFLWNGHDF